MSIYDPATYTWTTGASMPTARSNAGAAVFGNEIFVLGGVLEGQFAPITTVEAYDPAADTWRTNVAPMPIGRAEFTAVSLL